MEKSIIPDGMEGNEINVRLDSFIDELPDEIAKEIDYRKLDVNLPAWAYIMLDRKGFFGRDFLLALARSTCDAKNLKETITFEDKRQRDILDRIINNIGDGDIDIK